jgi:tRNA pseudouridine synthase 10
MLGTGRPFILEITEPKLAITGSANISQIEDLVNSTNEFVKVKNLQKVGKEMFEELRQGEENKLKVYACIVWLENPVLPSHIDKINSTYNLKVFQKTPIRVMHRRSLKTREKNVLKMKAVYINSHYIQLRLVTSGGTYVKEFVHSDFGRTYPSVSSLLGCKADILQLDVLGLGWTLEEVEGLLVSQIE